MGNAGDSARQSVGGHENSCGAGYCRAADDRADGGDFSAGVAESGANAGHGENWSDAGDGIAGSDQHGIGGGDRVDDAGGGFGVAGAGEADGIHGVLIPALHKIFFEAQLARGSVDAGFHARVAHGQDAGFDAESFADSGGRLGESFAFGQQTRTKKMCGEIAVSGVEPDGFAELSHRLQAVEGVALHAPSTLVAQEIGEDVSDGIDVGRNIEAPPEKVVAGVDYESDFFGGHDLAQAIDEFCAAGAAGEDADHAALRVRPWESMADCRR